MTFTIPDEILKAANLDERQLLVEIVCHLFDKGYITRAQAARFVGMNRTEFEDELHNRKIPAYRYDAENFQYELGAIEQSKSQAPSEKDP